jgi:hypothetical protein
LNDAKTAAIIKRKEITSSKTPLSSEQVAGCMDNNIWILTDSITAYNMQTLEPVITETMIAARNPFMQNNFSRFANNYLLDEAAKVLYITAADGEGYKLYTNDLLMKQDNSSSDPAPGEYSYEFAAEYKVTDRYPLKFALNNIDTFNSNLYILGSKKETSQVLSYFGSSIYNERDEIRQLTKIAYKKNSDDLDYKKNKPVTSIKQYYKGGFLQRKFSASAWNGPQGEKIILHNSKDKNKALLLVTFADKEGLEKWTVNTQYPATGFSDFLLDQKHLVIWFTAPSVNIPGSIAAFISIDLSSGNSARYVYQP